MIEVEEIVLLVLFFVVGILELVVVNVVYFLFGVIGVGGNLFLEFNYFVLFFVDDDLLIGVVLVL